MGAFAEAFPAFAARGVALVPTLPDTPSKPMVLRPDRFGLRACSRLRDNPKYANANGAIWTGPKARLTVVDVDSPDPRIQADAIHQHGETPVKVKTPSGGLHLYYRHACETRRIRPHGPALPLDILGSGLAVAPPSVRPATADKAGGVYRFLEGSAAELDRLPIVTPGSIPDPHSNKALLSSTLGLASMRVGDGRNVALFRIARAVAQDCTTQAELAEAVLAANETCDQPLPIQEAMKVTASAWAYKLTGRLILPSLKSGGLQQSDFVRCREYPLAMVLLAYLRMHHAADHLFAVVPDAIAPSLGLSSGTARKAREYLVLAGYLALERRGGVFGGNQVTNLYRLA